MNITAPDHLAVVVAEYGFRQDPDCSNWYRRPGLPGFLNHVPLESGVHVVAFLAPGAHTVSVTFHDVVVCVRTVMHLAGIERAEVAQCNAY